MLNLMKKKFLSPCGDKLKFVVCRLQFLSLISFRPLAGIS